MEDRRGAGRNFDRLARLGVAGRAGLAVPHLEGAESPDLYTIASGERLLHGGEKAVDHQRIVSLGDSWPDRFGDLLNEVGFGHPLSSSEVWPSLVVAWH